MLIELDTRNVLNSPRTDTIRHTVCRENVVQTEIFQKKKNNLKFAGSWRSSRRLLLSSGFSVTVCVVTLSERLLLEGGAWHHLHATLMSAVSRPLLLSCRMGNPEEGIAIISINFDPIAETWTFRRRPSRDALAHPTSFRM